MNSNDKQPLNIRRPVRLSEVPQNKLIVLTKNRVSKDEFMYELRAK